MPSRLLLQVLLHTENCHSGNIGSAATTMLPGLGFKLQVGAKTRPQEGLNQASLRHKLSLAC